MLLSRKESRSFRYKPFTLLTELSRVVFTGIYYIFSIAGTLLGPLKHARDFSERRCVLVPEKRFSNIPHTIFELADRCTGPGTSHPDVGKEGS